MEHDIKIENEKKDNKPKVDLSNVEEVMLNDNKKFIKFIDIQNNKPVMLDITNDNKSAKDIIEDLQLSSYSYNTQDAAHNTIGVLGLEQKYSKPELKIIEVDKINGFKDSIPQDKLPIIELFEKNKDNFNSKIKYINPEEGIAFDTENNVLVCEYNKEKNIYDVNYADTTKYNVEQKMQTSTIEGSIDGIDFEALVEQMETTNTPLEVSGYKVDMKQLNDYSNYPELLERKQLNPFEKMLWTKLLESYLRKKAKQNNLDNPPKIKKLIIKDKKPKSQAAFVSNNLTLFVAGFTTGIIFALILYYAIKAFF